jgi:ribose 1,5-bisphosphokinase PhnN
MPRYNVMESIKIELMQLREIYTALKSVMAATDMYVRSLQLTSRGRQLRQERVDGCLSS